MTEVLVISDLEYEKFLKSRVSELNIIRGLQTKELLSLKSEMNTLEADKEKSKYFDLIQRRADLTEECRHKAEGLSNCMRSQEIMEVQSSIETQGLLIKPMTERYAKLVSLFAKIRDGYKLNAAPSVFFADIQFATKITEKQKTDADGKFHIDKIPGQKFWLYAKAQRQVFDKMENYFWLVQIEQSEKSVILSNDNMLETGCINCARIPSQFSKYPEVDAMF